MSEDNIVQFPSKEIADSTVLDLLSAAMNQMGDTLENQWQYIVECVKDGETMTWISINDEDLKNSLRVSIALIDVNEWMEE